MRTTYQTECKDRGVVVVLLGEVAGRGGAGKGGHIVYSSYIKIRTI